MNRLFLNYVVGMVLVLGLSACGFHLRTDAAIALDLKSIYIDGGESDPELKGELIDAFERSQVEVTEQSENVNYVLKLDELESKRTVLSVGSGGNAAEFQLLLRVGFTLENAQSKQSSPPQIVEVQREQTNDDTAVLAVTDEQAQLFSEMRRDAVREILRRVQRATQKLNAT